MLLFQNGKFAEMWRDELLDAIPRALLFRDNGSSLVIFTLETGTVWLNPSRELLDVY